MIAERLEERPPALDDPKNHRLERRKEGRGQTLELIFGIECFAILGGEFAHPLEDELLPAPLHEETSLVKALVLELKTLEYIVGVVRKNVELLLTRRAIVEVGGDLHGWDEVNPRPLRGD